MKVIKADEFRSGGSEVNKDSDMVRVIVDMTKREYRELYGRGEMDDTI